MILIMDIIMIRVAITVRIIEVVFWHMRNWETVLRMAKCVCHFFSCSIIFMHGLILWKMSYLGIQWIRNERWIWSKYHKANQVEHCTNRIRSHMNMWSNSANKPNDSRPWNKKIFIFFFFLHKQWPHLLLLTETLCMCLCDICNHWKFITLF